MSYSEMGTIKRLDLQTTYRYMAETFRIYSYRKELQSCVDTRSNLMPVSHNGDVKFEYF